MSWHCQPEREVPVWRCWCSRAVSVLQSRPPFHFWSLLYCRSCQVWAEGFYPGDGRAHTCPAISCTAPAPPRTWDWPQAAGRNTRHDQTTSAPAPPWRWRSQYRSILPLFYWCSPYCCREIEKFSGLNRTHQLFLPEEIASSFPHIVLPGFRYQCEWWSEANPRGWRPLFSAGQGANTCWQFGSKPCRRCGSGGGPWLGRKSHIEDRRRSGSRRAARPVELGRI